MIQEDFDLIQEEFKNRKINNMKQTVITKGLIDRLFSKYNSVIFIENSYDSEPLEYDEWEELNKTEEGKKRYKKIVEEYELQRKRFCNWQDPYEEGNWDLTMKRIRELAKIHIQTRKKESYKEPRFYISENEDYTEIYYYGRDSYEQMDMWFSFYNRKENK